MKNTYLVCPIIVPCHSSVYFSKKFFFVLFFLFVYTPFMNSSVILSWYSLSLFICLPSFIKPCIQQSQMYAHSFLSTLNCSHWTATLQRLPPGVWGVQCVSTEWKPDPSEEFSRWAQASGWPNKSRLQKNYYYFFFFCFLDWLFVLTSSVHRFLFLLLFVFNNSQV